MSSSSATATASRSPSPATPESSDSSSHNPLAIQNGFELSSWYHSLHPEKPVLNGTAWDHDGTPHIAVEKGGEQPMLEFDDLIEEHAYDDNSSPFSSFDPSPVFPASPVSIPSSNAQLPVMQTPTQSMHASDTLVPSNTPVPRTKPIPPPAARPRKRDSFAAFQRVVYPPKESCYNLPIMVPSIPEGGTKSRVETQVRVTVDLAHASSSSEEPFKYDRVGSWKWLKLPAGTATKKRTRKEGKIDPLPQDMLYLTSTITCASPPYNPVLSCASCQTREAKRVARKLAARVRPARSDSDSPEDAAKSTSRSRQEDTTSIIQFNCPEVLDFTSGSVVLPLRITCYCRHHREKVGFNVHFTMMDHTGRIVGAGTSRPIMITDDHKTVNANRQGPALANGLNSSLRESDVDWSQFGQPTGTVELSSAVAAVDGKAPSKRKHAKEPGHQAKKRTKPYDAISRSNGNGYSARTSREASVVSLPSATDVSPSTPNTRSSTPSHFLSPGEVISQLQDSVSSRSSISGMGAMVNGDISGVSPSDTMYHRPDQLAAFGSADMGAATVQRQLKAGPLIPEQLAVGVPTNTHFPTTSAPSSQLVPGVIPPQPMPYMFFDPSSPPPMSSLPLPKIHRLIPAAGPTYGGIEVTVLGANFHPAMTLNCVFGDAVASSTQRWSDNTLVCLLPPRASPGVVAVWFDGVQKENELSPPCLFTYTDESDRALMELALQVVGLKMTGKIEDAKNVAMRIVGTSGVDESPEGGDTSNMMQLATTSYRNIRPLLLTRAGDGEDFESVIVDFLSVLDVDVDQSTTTISSAISHTTPSGQTLLHLAAMLGFTVLVQFLIKHDVDLDVRDRNGYTALHFTVIGRSEACARLLVDAGADLEIVNVLGKTPQEQAPFGFFDDIISDRSDGGYDSAGEEDDESRWGDGEEDEDDVVPVSRRSLNRAMRRRSETSVFEEKHSIEDARPYPMDDKKHIVDEKQTASFVDMIHRTLAQLYAPHGIIPNMPQLPLPHLPEMPAVPWGALPHIPVVFPVFVPMPGWPSLRGEKRDNGQDTVSDKDGNRAPAGSSAIRAAQEWRATCEKWMALAMATATMRQQEEVPPPMYTPRTISEDARRTLSPQSEPEDDGESSSTTARPHSHAERPMARRFGYPSVPITEQDVNAYGYRPTKSQAQKLLKKDDRMLIWFWIPILLASLLWALYTGTRFALQTLRNVIPLQTGTRA